MKETFGKRFSDLRKLKKLTQEEIAERVNISPQAVSKWENDISLPDISILPTLADILDVSLDELLGRIKKREVKMVKELEKHDINKMSLKIKVISGKDKINVNLPIPLVKVCIETGMKMPQINNNEIFSSIDFSQIYALIEQGVIGELVTIESANGDYVVITVE